MKTLITLLLLTSFALSAQQRDDNTIIIENFGSFDKIETLLMMNFYEVEINETRFSTKPKPIEGSVYAYDLNVSLHGFLVDGQLIAYANYTFRGGMMTAETYSGRARWSRRQNVGSRIAFDELQRVIKQLGYELSYREMN